MLKQTLCLIPVLFHVTKMCVTAAPRLPIGEVTGMQSYKSGTGGECGWGRHADKLQRTPPEATGSSGGAAVLGMSSAAGACRQQQEEHQHITPPVP